MEKQIEIPKRCGICEYLTELPSQDQVFNVSLFACSHKMSFDDDQIPLFVMPSEPPPEFCGLNQKNKAHQNLKNFRSLFK